MPRKIHQVSVHITQYTMYVYICKINDVVMDISITYIYNLELKI